MVVYTTSNRLNALQMENLLDNDIKFLTGVGERRAALLAKELNIHTVGDMLYYFPFRYVDRTKIYRIADLSRLGEQKPVYIQLRGRIRGFSIEGEGAKRRLKAQFVDGSGAVELVWFKGIAWVQKRLETEREYLLFGRPSLYGNQLSIVHPEMELMQQVRSRPGEGVQGVYTTTERLTSANMGTKVLYNLVCNAWDVVQTSIRETLPERIIVRYGLMSLREALYNIHFPHTQHDLEQARYRLKFEELLGVQLGILSQRTLRHSKNNGFVFARIGDSFNRFYSTALPFALTDAQKRVIREIRADMASGSQMNRLLQGDVGSGKTLVALMSMLIGVDNGFQSCMMAPTEILARQHMDTFVRMLSGSGIEVALLTGATRAKQRREIADGLLSGRIKILLGTHALLEDKVQFANLGLVVIDEQHRFGVEQRAKMWTKNLTPPHVLIMTATPIPRTLAMTLYGDLDVSVIDQLPPGRKPIETTHFFESRRLQLIGFLRREIARGRQAYVVYPLIKESEAMDYMNLYDGFEALSRDFPLPEYNIIAVHGKMPADEKAECMRLFKEGMAQIMVATSVIEVGVDVPNATIMVIESAERFGLSQLHQLRGRVGRGAEQSYCVLMSGDKLSREARARLQAMVETNDGFRLAELDMKLRGAGDLSGTQQSGMTFDLKIANLGTDSQLVDLTRRLTEWLIDHEADMTAADNLLLSRLKAKYLTSDNRDFSMIS